MILQEYLNPPDRKKEEKEYGNKKFRVGDKVMQIKNNYQLEWEVKTKYGLTVDKGVGIFNGDMGIVKKIDHYQELMTVEYEEGKQVEYSLKCWRSWSWRMRSRYINPRGASIRRL